jgi:type VI secretion system protein ImpE
MDAHQQYRDGDLEGAIATQIAFVRDHPADNRGRSFLFGLLCAAGDLERAERQIEALASLDPSFEAGVLVYRHLLHSEAARRDAFAGKGQPLLPPDAGKEMEQRVSALAHLAAGRPDEAGTLIDAAAEAAPLLSGKANGEAFDALRDGDDLLATVLEVHAGGRYLWVPLANVSSLEIEPPVNPTDLVWAPAKLIDTSGNEASVYLPATYPGSHEGDDLLRLGRTTAFEDAGPRGSRGQGQHLLLAYRGDEEREIPLLELRHLEIEG